MEIMNKSIHQTRLKALREKLADNPSDAFWVIQPENRRYLSGFKALDAQLNESSGSLLINKRNAFLITDSRYTIEAEKEAPDFKVVTLKKGVVDGLPGLCRRLKTKVLGFEGGHLVWDLHRDLFRAFKKLDPAIKLKPMNGLIEEMRLIKSPSEIKIMDRSSRLMCSILDEIIRRLKPGQTEKELAREIEGLAREGGAEDLAFSSIVASGPNGALPHAVPSGRKIKKGEPIIFDVGVKVDGYCCDMTRTVFLGEPNREFKKIYRTVRQAQLAALKIIRPGIQSNIPDRAARDIIKAAGFGDYFGHATGHGVGLATHEEPRLAPTKPVELKEGMIVTVEPGIYIPGKGGVRLEEMTAIGKKGSKILTNYDFYYDF